MLVVVPGYTYTCACVYVCATGCYRLRAQDTNAHTLAASAIVTHTTHALARVALNLPQIRLWRL